LCKETLIKQKIAFHIPRKDQCRCYNSEQKSTKERASREEQQLHRKRKPAADTVMGEDGENLKKAR
jgi:hypothetical protein